MNGNCHFIFGAAVGSMVALNLGAISTVLPQVTNTPETATLMVMGGLLGGIFPDIDNPSSHIGQLSAPVSTIIGKVNKLCGKKGANHRGILHDPFIYLIGLVCVYFGFAPLLGFLLGCFSHIFLDMFNPKGIPLFFGLFNLSLAKFKSGELSSIIFTWICVFITLIVGITLHLT